MLTKTETFFQQLEAERANCAGHLVESRFQPLQAANDPDCARQMSLQRRLRRQRRSGAATRSPASGWRISLW